MKIKIKSIDSQLLCSDAIRLFGFDLFFFTPSLPIYKQLQIQPKHIVTAEISAEQLSF